jgi:hypothetical protein
MTSQALKIARQIDSMTDPEVDFLLDFLRKRRNESLLRTIDLKLDESMREETLSDSDVAARREILGIAR